MKGLRAAVLCTATDPDAIAYQDKKVGDYALESGLIITTTFRSTDEIIADGGSSYDVVLTAEDVKLSGVMVIKV